MMGPGLSLFYFWGDVRGNAVRIDAGRSDAASGRCWGRSHGEATRERLMLRDGVILTAQSTPDCGTGLCAPNGDPFAA